MEVNNQLPFNSEFPLNGEKINLLYTTHNNREKPTQQWIIAEKSGTICTAQCDCMAGLGGECSDVASLMFEVEATVNLRNSNTLTTYWSLSALLK
ncbi:hypothetical protein CHS0354_041401 [Potamilus streckersoni]|uniref:Uncharacterized protein n=1 Tax=Potamilus streckersoni TaxID=2493646 RepID=A0AAE0T9W3_9BIVA|nr:hypothetical protein CHS0354_041401 [Potamilus streckersoni]